jgi:hypothetical protein
MVLDMLKRTIGIVALAVVSILLAVACGGDGDDQEALETQAATEESDGEAGNGLQAPFGFDLSPLGESEISGQVTITPSGSDEAEIETVLDNAGSDMRYPVNVFEGTCDDLGSNPAESLDLAEDGISDAVVDLSAQELVSGDYAVAVSQSEENLDVHLACGEIPSLDEVLQG